VISKKGIVPVMTESEFTNQLIGLKKQKPDGKIYFIT